MRHFLLLLSLLLSGVAHAQPAPPTIKDFETAMAADVKVLTEMATLLKSVKDEASAKAAFPKLKVLLETPMEVEKLGPPTEEVELQLLPKAQKLGIQKAFGDFLTEAFRVSEDGRFPEISAAIDAMQERRTILPPPEPGEDSKPLLQCIGHTQGIYDVDYSPDGKWIASIAWNKTLKIWDAATGREKISLEMDATLVRFLRDNKTMVVDAQPEGEFRGLYLVEVLTGKVLGEITTKGDRPDSPNSFYNLDVNAAGMACAGSNLLGLWKMPRAQLVGAWPVEGIRSSSMAMSPDGKRIATSDGTLFDTTKGAVVTTIRTHSDGGELKHSVAFSPDNKEVGYRDTFGIQFLDAATGQALRKMESDPFNAFMYSPNGKVFARCSNGVTLHDPQTFKQVFRVATNDNYVIDCAFSPDGKRLVTGYNDGGIEVWDVSQFATPLPMGEIALEEEPAATSKKPMPEKPAPVNPALTKPEVRPTKPMAELSRTWKTADEKFQVEATYVEHDATSVTLKRKDGKVITVKLELLSEGDQEFLKGRQ